MPRVDKVVVSHHGIEVGTIARTADGLYPYEYSDGWVASGFPISPLSLPLQKGVRIPKREPLDGMFGVFHDSLPDGWGQLLVDRMLRKEGHDPASIDLLDRLAIVGSTGMGSLEYIPQWAITESEPSGKKDDLDRLAAACMRILSHAESEDLDALFVLGGSSGGARPKVLVEIEGQDWIVKFPSSSDPPDIGRQEYDYALCARECGIIVPEVALFPSRMNEGYFGIKRFDRDDAGRRIPMASASGFLETSHRIPNLDYSILMKLVMKVSHDFDQAKRLFRLMCFNVFAHNRDDHAKNFSFLYDEGARTWLLSPAYDLTYSSSLGGEHATTVNGNGADPGIDDVLAVADEAGLSKRWTRITAREISDAAIPLATRYRP